MGPGIVPPEDEERAKHISAIASLSEQHHLPPDAVAAVYERELALISEDALITTYLPIFVTRRVSELLRTLAATATPISSGGRPNFAR
jgi:hypothetical protein